MWHSMMDCPMTSVFEDRMGVSGESQFEFSASVERGSGRGQGLGFPTANLAVDPGLADTFQRGVYAARVRWARGREYGAVINIGVRPTFSDDGLVVEAHILDFSGDLYGETLDVTVSQRLREERPFSDVRSLVRQIEKDVEMARAALS